MKKDLISTPKKWPGGGRLNSEKIVEKADKNGTFSDLKTEENTLKKEQKTAKIYALIISIIFLFTALVGGSVFLIVNHINKPLATTESATLTTNLFNTDGTINETGVNELLSAVGYTAYPNDIGTYTAHNIATRGTDNSGSTIIFPMGYVNGTSGDPLYWQATYLHNNYLTIWLSKSYTKSAWDAKSTVQSSIPVSYDSYANSTVQAYLDDTFWPLLTQSKTILQSIFATPATAGYQTLNSGTTNDTGFYYSSGTTSKFDNMSTIVGNSSYMWLPSFGEVFNNKSSSYTSSTTSYTGMWGLNKTDRSFSTSLYYTGSSSTDNYCWLRSGISSAGDYAMYVLYSDSASSSRSFISKGVRPAAHLSLSVIASALSKTISVTSNNSTYGSVSGGGDYANNSSVPLAATPNTGYKFKGWSIDGGNTIISTANPYTITVTQNATYTAVFEIKTYNITFNVNNSNLGSIYSHYTTFEHGSTYTFVATPIAGCAFLYWIDSAEPSTRIYANPLTVAITSDKTYTAYFTDSLQNGVSVVAEAGGEARINGYTDSDTTIHFSAVAYAGYTFDGWYIYGESTALSTEWSVDLEKSTINNKLIVAKFSEISANVNTETNNTDKLT